MFLIKIVFLLRKKLFILCSLGVGIYILSLFIPSESNVIINSLTSTTTTTTPTPLILLMNLKNNLSANITIEKYDPLKVHDSIMKRKIMRMTQRLQKQHDLATFNLSSNNNVHLFYSEYLRPSKTSSDQKNSSYLTVQQNLKIARSIGAGVIFFSCSRLSQSLIAQTAQQTHHTLKLLFELAPKYGIKVSLAIQDYVKRNVMSIRRDIRIFSATYGGQEALYKIKKPGFSVQLPVIYIMESYMISSSEWSEVLTQKGKFTIRNTASDAFVLGHLMDEEHTTHLRLAHFDGFFTCCNNNGDTFGSTWKNWQTLSVWALGHQMPWSAGLGGGTLAVETGLKTALRSQPGPQFVSLAKVPLTDEYISFAQSWLRKWPNTTLRDIY